MSTGLGIVIVLYIIILLCRYSYYLGWKARERKMREGVYTITADFPSIKTINGKPIIGERR